MQRKQTGGNAVDSMRKFELNPAITIAVGLLVVAGLLYAFVVRPNQELDKKRREWNSPEAAAARSPEGHKVSPAYENALKAALEKEGRTRKQVRQ
jgi:hypothetical protein